MDEAGDWRLTGQERYLTGAMLRWAACHPPRPGWDHDHCEFCWAKFAGPDVPEALRAGYTTPDRYRWVCPQCVADFRERCGWKVVGEQRPAEPRTAPDAGRG